jgi:hypothetical protein
MNKRRYSRDVTISGVWLWHPSPSKYCCIYRPPAPSLPRWWKSTVRVQWGGGGGAALIFVLVISLCVESGQSWRYVVVSYSLGVPGLIPAKSKSMATTYTTGNAGTPCSKTNFMQIAKYIYWITSLYCRVSSETTETGAETSFGTIQTRRLFRLFRFNIKTGSFGVSKQPKQTKDQPKQQEICSNINLFNSPCTFKRKERIRTCADDNEIGSGRPKIRIRNTAIFLAFSCF